ncbi:MAG: translation initiation factor IF-2 [Puniceicoccaceae bacterium 5H]|nr:MAG: translation initiation factor IF-2 [Puniceicoccaceae bacterium 5H]
MAVRIYELSKDIGMDNAELITLLKKRGYKVKSASSTIDNISAESLRDEFGKSDDAAGGDSAGDDGDQDQASAPNAPKLPAGAVVRSKADIERERAEREAKEQSNKQQAPRVVTPPRPQGGNAPSVKAPPPLPKRPPVTMRPPQPAASQGGANAPRAVVPPRPAPKSPVLRSDLPTQQPEAEAPKAPESPQQKAPEARQPQQPEARKGPAPIAPPRVNAPQKMSPPRPAAPQKMAPPPVSRPSGPKPMTPPKVTPPQAAPDAPEQPEEEAVAAAGGAELRKLQVKTPVVVRDFAVQIGKKPFQLISELMELGIFASMNTAIEEEVATKIARSHGFELEVKHRGESQPQPQTKAKKKESESEEMEPRAPVVCILGHVDHGKTTLLDTIRHTSVVKGEAGGITQHVGAYQVEHNEKKITFIDTPGHAAFSNMRARGANITDIAVLVVAADDGFMPQTDEALSHARKAGVPVVIAINKMDAPGAKPDRVRQQLIQRDLAPEELGGETLAVEVSALKGKGIEDLLEAILLQAEVTEGIEAPVKGKAEGVVIEAQKELGRGSTASVIITAGTLKTGAALVCGEHYCRVRQLINDQGKQIKSATPGTPVKVTGWSSPPDAGDNFVEVKNEREAKSIAEDNELERKKLEAAQKEEGRASVEDLFAAIARTQKKTFKCVVKSDVYGTAEALAAALLAIKSDKIDLDVIDMGVGDITKNDVIMADAAEGATIVAFNVGLENGVQAVAKHHSVQVIKHNIIYELIDQVKSAMADLLDPEFRENKIGAAEVRATFPLGKGQVAGCMVTEGSIKRDHLARLFRKGNQEAEAKVDTLKRFKEDVGEVRAGYECGLQLRDRNDYEVGDIIECYEILKIKPSL